MHFSHYLHLLEGTQALQYCQAVPLLPASSVYVSLEDLEITMAPVGMVRREEERREAEVEMSGEE